MTRAVRLGAVSYLNARPLVYSLAEDPGSFELRCDVPAVCADLLAREDIDLGLVPSITYASGSSIVPGVSIASDGPVDSVAIYTKVPAREIRSFALDTSSRTSVALTRILCKRRFDIAPSFVPHAPDLTAMLDACDAALLIGDPALFAGPLPSSVTKIDLGQAWHEMTGLPFVWAFWVGKAGNAAIQPRVVQRLQETRRSGVAHSDEIADEFGGADATRRDIARRYLRENIQYDLTPRMLQGLQSYYREAHQLGLIGEVPTLNFFAAQ